jgi:hypothetical protein
MGDPAQHREDVNVRPSHSNVPGGTAGTTEADVRHASFAGRTPLNYSVVCATPMHRRRVGYVCRPRRRVVGHGVPSRAAVTRWL